MYLLTPEEQAKRELDNEMTGKRNKEAEAFESSSNGPLALFVLGLIGFVETVTHSFPLWLRCVIGVGVGVGAALRASKSMPGMTRTGVLGVRLVAFLFVTVPLLALFYDPNGLGAKMVGVYIIGFFLLLIVAVLVSWGKTWLLAFRSYPVQVGCLSVGAVWVAYAVFGAHGVPRQSVAYPARAAVIKSGVVKPPRKPARKSAHKRLQAG